jgi:hypothetical protein
MVEIIHGATNKPATAEILKKFFKENPDLDGILYIAYPILFSGEKSITIDALWISQKYGILIFDFIEKQDDYENYKERQDEIYSLLDSTLRAYPELRRNRNFLVNIEIVSFAPNLSMEGEYIVRNNDELRNFISHINTWKHPELFNTVLSILQSVIRLKKREKRPNVTKSNSRGAKLKRLERDMAVLDRNQEKAVIEYFEGVQRIRGLAGSGKTIVLALKAAYLHTQNPDWDIAVTFNTRALKHRARVRVHLGTAEIMGRVSLLDRDLLQPGETAGVQLLLEEAEEDLSRLGSHVPPDYDLEVPLHQLVLLLQVGAPRDVRPGAGGGEVVGGGGEG